MQFPKNILITVAHASFEIPDFVREKLSDAMLAYDSRLLKNFSDFGTSFLISDLIADNQIISARFSRAIGDPNRCRDGNDLFREIDFNKNAVWKESLSEDEKLQCLSLGYDKFHKLLQQKIDSGKFDLLVDVHDTGNKMLGAQAKEDSDRTPSFCAICLSNNDGRSCSQELFSEFAKLLEKYFSTSVQKNDPYKGGYITQEYGKVIPTIQIEFGRFLYMDEVTQTVDKKKAADMAEKLFSVLCELQLACKKRH